MPNRPRNGRRNQQSNQRNNAGRVARAPVATSRTTRTGKPQMRGTYDKTVIVHREFVDDVPGSIAFSLKEYAVNPGNPALFPWLSQIAT